jgi:nucleoside-diphosphate-sugar epimerase
MRVALTGASGFIGQHVLNVLLQQNVEVVAVTRDSNKLAHVAEKIEILVLDINADSNAFQLMGSPDVLIHLAWDGLPNYKSLHHFETELPKQYRFLKKMVESGLQTLFVSGTCFEYGMQSGALAPDTATNPTNPYGYAKDALRKQLEYLKESIPFNLIWARLFYMFGQGQATQSLYSQLAQAVVRGDKTFNMSGGEQLRDYLPIETVANQIVNQALSKKDVGVMNICSGKPISVKNLVELWKKENNWNIALNLGFYPYPDYEPMEFWGVNEV